MMPGMSLASAVTEQIRRRMIARSMSQTALARAAGIPPTLLHRTFNGERPLTIDELGAVAAVLEVTPEHVLRVARAHPDG